MFTLLLQVLSSKLMPISVDLATRISSQAFCDDFLSVGGLQMVVNVLQAESLAPEVNYTIRQGCYAICLQLARFLLCGQTVSTDIDDAHGGSEETKSASSSLLASSPQITSFVKQSAGSHTVQVSSQHFLCQAVGGQSYSTGKFTTRPLSSSRRAVLLYRLVHLLCQAVGGQYYCTGKFTTRPLSSSRRAVIQYR